MTKNKTFYIGAFLIVIFLTGFLLIVAQTSPIQETQNEKTKRLEAEQTKELDQITMYSKRSLTEIPVDDGNRITAIRRIKMPYEEFDDKAGQSFTKKRDFVEIEIYGKLPVPVTNAAEPFLIIGESVFPVSARSGDGHSIFVRLKPEKFELLKENALIRVIYTRPLLEKIQQDLKEEYTNGEPKEITGAKFGRLDKAMIDKFPVIEEDEEGFLKRVNQSNVNQQN